jgi:hypothetical protein
VFQAFQFFSSCSVVQKRATTKEDEAEEEE